MNETTQGILILSVMIVISSLAWHELLNSYVVAIICSSVTAVVAFQIANYFHLGYIDPFFLIAIAVSGVISAFASAIIGVVYRVVRKKKTKNI